nr:reverse transcriptase domain-containing protein [Tanacetum cinerariifolium]
MKSLKEKVEDRLVKQDQSLQTVHMLCRPRPLYNDRNKVAIGYKNPLCLTRAKQAQPALYNGHEILKDNHAPAKFSEFDKTCKKRITPTAITEACYLQEIIPFFKTIKDNFEVIQKALTKEVKEMKDVFEELEVECMRTRNSYFLNNLFVTIPRRQNKRRTPNVVEPELRTIVEITPMVDNRTMKELLQAPTEGYREAIVISEINADHFEIKKNLLQLVQANPYHGFERENPHTHINNFKRVTSTLKFRDVPNDVIKLMMFSYSLEGTARVWYDKEPPNSILTWEDLETFGEAWERFKEMLRACPHHGFTKLTQIDTFYNGLNENDQDSLNAAAGGNILIKTTRESLHIIENKSKVRYSKNKPNVSRLNTTSRENASKTDDRIDKLADQILTLVDIVSKKVVTPATVKVVEESCVTCGGNNSYYNCDATNSNQSSVCAATGTYNQATASTSETLLSNTIPNPKGKMKAITTRSGVAYEGPSIPTSKKVVKRETEETTDKEQTNFQGSNAHIQPLVVPISEPDVPKTLSKPNIPYPLRLNDQKLCEKATNQMEKFFQIFQDLHLDISFADASLLMPKFASTINCNTPKKCVSQRNTVRGRYFIIQQHKIQENDL